MAWLKWSRFVLCIMLALAPAGALWAKDAKPAAKQAPALLKVVGQPIAIDSGKLRGLVVGEQDEVHLYRGIPYAAPPVGDLRWRAPQPPAKWEGVRECYEFGNASPQKASPLLAMFPGMTLDAPQSEDCLYLNVWTPAAKAESPLPVLVWIHGGGYVMGAASQRMYDSTDVARRGAVVVSINYRLGPLGFLAHPELSAESEHKVSGNYGLLDQIEALRWVQRNIAAFGGDPNRVTIFGESAGGGSVFSLIVSPLAKGLFHRAIAESGPMLNFAGLNRPYYGFQTAEAAGLEYAKSCGVAAGAGQVAALRKLSVEDLLKTTAGLEAQREFELRSNLLKLAPVVDGYVIPDDPMTILAEGKHNAVPLIVGANADEGTMFTMVAKLPKTADDFYARLGQTFGPGASVLRELYPATNAAEVRKAATEFLGDLVFVAPARFVARSMAASNSPTYLYHFAHPPAGPSGKMLGAHHAAEVVYVFDNLELSSDLSPADHAIRDALVGYWIEFAAKGDPNREGLPAWPAYDARGDQSLLINGKIEAVSGLRKPRLDAIDGFVDAWRKESGVTR